MQVPAEFRKLCGRFFQDIFLVTSSDDERAQFLIDGLTQEERRRLRQFLDEVIAQHSAEQLISLWNNTPADFFLLDGEGIRLLLKRVRDRIDRP